MRSGSQELPVLYGRTPVGAGTGSVESLTSYLMRLSRARHLSASSVLTHLVHPVISQQVASDAHSKVALWSCRYLKTAHRFNAEGGHAQALVAALARLGTLGQEALVPYTLLPWREVLTHSRGVDVKHARWCASCFAQWELERTEAWIPLLWCLASAHWCPEHRVRLKSRCVSCGRQHFVVFSAAVPLGHCPYCGASLAQHESSPQLSSLGSRDLWNLLRSFASKRLLQAHSANFSVPRGSVARGLRAMVAQEKSRGGSVHSIAKRLAASATAFYNQLSPDSRLTLTRFIDFSLVLEEDPLHLAGAEARTECWSAPSLAGTRWADAVSLFYSVREADSEKRDNVLAALLDRELDKDCPGALNMIIKTHRVTDQSLWNKFPLRVRQVMAKRHASYQRKVHSHREVLFSTLRDSLEPVCAGELARHTGISLGAFRRLCPELYEATRRSSVEYQGKKASQEAGSVQALKRAFEEALLQAPTAAPAPNAVARGLGFTRDQARYFVPSLYRRLIALRKRGRSQLNVERRSRLIDALRREVASEAPRSLAEVVRSLGLSDYFAYRLAPDLIDELAARRRDAHRSQRAQLTQRCREALEKELRATDPRSVIALARATGLPSYTLYYYCSDLCRKLTKGVATSRRAHRSPKVLPDEKCMVKQPRQRVSDPDLTRSKVLN